jgi:acyl-coenzyme A thioesterase PaaI-like protein
VPPHINQPGGDFRASMHPRIAGRERELRSLADAVRRLVLITVDSDAGAPATAEAAARLHAIADELQAMVRDRDPVKYAAPDVPPGSHPHDHFQLDAVLGLYNPLALPVEMDWEPPKAVGHASFTSPYEGPPGCVHGAVLAGAFDQVFNVANMKNGAAGPTAYLHVDYRRPTRLREDVLFEGWVERVEGRKILCRGRTVQSGEVTCEAEGLFIRMTRDRVERLAGTHDAFGAPSV